MKKMTPVSSGTAKPVEAPAPANVESTYGSDEPDAQTLADAEHALTLQGVAPGNQNENIPANDWDWSQLARPPFILSWVDDDHPNGGFVIGWDTCGACSLHIRTCTCKNGPEQPVYVKRWRRKDDTKHDKPASLGKAVGKAVVTADPAEVEAKVAEVTAPVKTRKPRSDAGKPRGPRVKGTADSVLEAAGDLSTAMTKG